MSLSLLLLLLLPLRFWPFRHLFVKRALFQFHFVAAGDAGASANDSVVVYWNSILCLSLVWDTLRFFALFPKKIQIGPDQPKHDRNFLPPNPRLPTEPATAAYTLTLARHPQPQFCSAFSSSQAGDKAAPRLWVLTCSVITRWCALARTDERLIDPGKFLGSSPVARVFSPNPHRLFCSTPHCTLPPHTANVFARYLIAALR